MELSQGLGMSCTTLISNTLHNYPVVLGVDTGSCDEECAAPSLGRGVKTGDKMWDCGEDPQGARAEYIIHHSSCAALQTFKTFQHLIFI